MNENVVLCELIDKHRSRRKGTVENCNWVAITVLGNHLCVHQVSILGECETDRRDLGSNRAFEHNYRQNFETAQAVSQLTRDI